MDLETRLRSIKLLIMDVDGVLTEGQIIYGQNGVELKAFNVRDGHGIKLIHRAGLKTAIITGRESEAVTRRAQELDISYLIQNAKNKIEAYREILKESGFKEHEVAFIGDDLVDIPVMRRVGVAVTPSDGHELVKQYALLITRKKGGQGAVRELIEIILKAQGKWEKVVARYLE